MFADFSHCMKEIPPEMLTTGIIEAFTCVFDAKKHITLPNVMEMKTDINKQVKMTSC